MSYSNPRLDRNNNNCDTVPPLAVPAMTQPARTVLWARDVLYNNLKLQSVIQVRNDIRGHENGVIIHREERKGFQISRSSIKYRYHAHLS